MTAILSQAQCVKLLMNWDAIILMWHNWNVNYGGHFIDKFIFHILYHEYVIQSAIFNIIFIARVSKVLLLASGIHFPMCFVCEVSYPAGFYSNNGQWSVGIKIDDKSGLCAESTLKVILMDSNNGTWSIFRTVWWVSARKTLTPVR